MVDTDHRQQCRLESGQAMVPLGPVKATLGCAPARNVPFDRCAMGTRSPAHAKCIPVQNSGHRAAGPRWP